MAKAHVLAGIGFATKPALALTMIERTLKAGVPFAFVAANYLGVKKGGRRSQCVCATARSYRESVRGKSGSHCYMRYACTHDREKVSPTAAVSP